MEISRFAARARRGVNVQNEIRFDVYDNIMPLLKLAAIPLRRRAEINMYAAAAIPIAYSLFPIAYSLFPIPYCLFPNP